MHCTIACMQDSDTRRREEGREGGERDSDRLMVIKTAMIGVGGDINGCKGKEKRRERENERDIKKARKKEGRKGGREEKRREGGSVCIFAINLL